MFRHQAYDAIVIGAGPAGSTTAALLAHAGRRVLLLERDPEPRFKIGESLMPQSYWTLHRLGVLESMKDSLFPKKYSVQFYSKSGKPSQPFYFFEESSHESSMTWQVLRSEFDELLLTNAVTKGAECHRGVNVKEVLFDGKDAHGVRAALPDGSLRQVRARVVVDATGQSTLLARHLKLRRIDDCLTHASIFTHFSGGLRDSGIDEGATLILHTQDQESWFWYIPLPGDVASVGVVGPVEYLIGGRQGSPEETFEEERKRCPALEKRLGAARQIRKASVLRDFSYRSTQVAGSGWVLVGDAFSFVDPIYSSGVFLALKSGELAADSILAAFESEDFSGQRLGSFGPRLERAMEAIRQLVYAFYVRDFSFARFLKGHPEHRQAVISILTGDVFDKDFSRLFSDMEAMRSELVASMMGEGG